MSMSRREFLCGAAAFASTPPFAALSGCASACPLSSSDAFNRSVERRDELIAMYDEATSGSLQPDGVKTVIWRGVNLRGGDNEIEVSAGGMSRRACWRLKGEHIR